MKKYAECQDLNDLTPHELSIISVTLYNLGEAHYEQGNDDRALKYLLEQEDLHKKTGVEGMNATLNLAFNYWIRSSIYIGQENWEDAEHYLNEVDIYCRLLRENKRAKGLAVQAKGALANILVVKGQHDKALELYDSVLEQAGDLEEAVKAKTLKDAHHGVAMIYVERGDIDKAVDSWAKGFEGAVKDFGENSNEAYFFSHQMAALLFEHQQPKRAQQYAEKSLEIALKACAEDSAEAAYNYVILGHICLANQDFPKALDSLKKGCAISETLSQYPSDLPPLSMSYFKMAQICGFQDDFQDASNFFAKADEAIVKEKGKDEMGLFNIYVDWARALQAHDFLKEQSKTYFKKALKILEGYELKRKEPIWAINATLGQMAFDEKDWIKACEHYKECEKCFPDTRKDPKDLQTIQSRIGTSLFYLDNLDEAEKYFQKFFQSYKATGDINGVGNVYDYIGKIHEQRGLLKEALEAYQNAVEGLKAVVEPDHPRVQDALKKVSEIEKKLSQ